MPTRTKTGNAVVETIKTVVYAVLIAVVFRTLFLQPFWIPSGSMKETLLIGDFLFVNKMAYGYSYASCPNLGFMGVSAENLCGFMKNNNTRIWGGEPERGDVVVFWNPVSEADTIKRLVGLPGDRIQVKDGILHINGTAVPQQPDGVFEEVMAPQGPTRALPRCENAPVGTSGTCTKSRAIETLPNGRSYTVLNTEDSWTDNTGIYSVPAGEYFFMGDNRDNSADSRVIRRGVGVKPRFVPYENLIGRADRIMFSAQGRSLLFFWSWRGGRFFKKIE